MLTPLLLQKRSFVMNGVSAVNSAVQLRMPAGSAASVQEATETAAVTKQEAAKGDQQAIRKLARTQQQNQPAQTEEAKESTAEKAIEAQKSAAHNVSPEGVGKAVNLLA